MLCLRLSIETDCHVVQQPFYIFTASVNRSFLQQCNCEIDKFLIYSLISNCGGEKKIGQKMWNDTIISGRDIQSADIMWVAFNTVLKTFIIINIVHSVDLLCWFVLSFYIHWHSQIKWLIISILFSLTNKCWWTYDVCDTARWIKHVRHFQLQPLIVATLSKFQLEIYIMKQSHLLRICAWSTHKLNVLSAIFANKLLAIREYQHRQRHWNQIWHKKIMQPDETENARNAHGSS